MFKPAIEVVKNTANEAFKTRLKSKLDKLADATIRNSTSVDQSLPEASSEIADSTEIKVPPRLKQEYRNQAANMRREIVEIRRAIDKLEAARAPLPPYADAEPPRPQPVYPDPIQPREPEAIPDSPVGSTPSSGGGGGGFSSFTSSCICNTYMNGALISSVPIPVGARCGFQVCGRDMPAH